jgi:hypothetical protein
MVVVPTEGKGGQATEAFRAPVTDRRMDCIRVEKGDARESGSDSGIVVRSRRQNSYNLSFLFLGLLSLSGEGLGVRGIGPRGLMGPIRPFPRKSRGE